MLKGEHLVFVAAIIYHSRMGLSVEDSGVL